MKITSARRGPHKAGGRAFLSRWPLDYTPGLLDAPQAYRTGTVLMCGPRFTVIAFDDGERTTVNTKALNQGEPSK